MTRHHLLIPFVFFLVSVSGCTNPPEDGLKKLQGNWEFIHLTDKGKSTPAEELKNLEVIFANDRMQLVNNGKPYLEYTFRVNVRKSPAEIDVVHLDGKDQGKAEYGIYAFEGDQLKMCVAYLGKSRPTTLAGEPRADCNYFIVRKKS